MSGGVSRDETICPFCGAGNPAGADHCSSCGRPAAPMPGSANPYAAPTAPPDTTCALRLVPAKIIVKGKRVYFRKRCATHGVREDFICSDVALYDQMQYSLPGKVPPHYGVEPDKGCPFDCGLCTEHEQHTCVGLVEMTSSCNLNCPMCFSSSGPGGNHLSYDECIKSIDRLVA